jgi:UDP-glucose:(heptosyl)LPS alpha-1,3-glucosyltransferase
MTSYKLAFVIERYFEFGGLQRDMRRFALACATEGHQVTVFANRWEAPPDPSMTVEVLNLTKSSNHRTIRQMEAFVLDLRQQNRYDCIVGFNRMGGLDVYFGGDVCLKAKLQRQHQLWRRILPRYRTYLELEAAVFGPAGDTDVMLISPNEAHIYQSAYQTAPQRVHLLPPGIDRERFAVNPLPGEKRNLFRKEFNAHKNDLLILTVGSSFRTKGIDRAIQAIAGLPQELKRRCRYAVAGQGDENQFAALARKAGIGEHVFFTGGRRDIESFYYAADVLLHPARTENTGTTLLEAMVAGLAVIATENCGYAPYIQQADGGRVCREPFDPAALNQVLGEVLSDDSQRLRYGQNGRDFCRTADLYSMVEKGVRVILNRAEKNRNRR